MTDTVREETGEQYGTSYTGCLRDLSIGLVDIDLQNSDDGADLLSCD